MSEKPERSSPLKFWTVSAESETNRDGDLPYDDPPIHFTSLGERYIHPNDLVHSKHAWDRVKKLEAFVKDQKLPLQRAQGFGLLSSED